MLLFQLIIATTTTCDQSKSLSEIYCNTRSQYPASSWWQHCVTSSKPTHSLEVRCIVVSSSRTFFIFFHAAEWFEQHPVSLHIYSLHKCHISILTDGFCLFWITCVVCLNRKEAFWCFTAVHGLGQTLRLPVVSEWPQRQLWRLEGDLHRQQQCCKSKITVRLSQQIHPNML